MATPLAPPSQRGRVLLTITALDYGHAVGAPKLASQWAMASNVRMYWHQGRAR